MTAGGIYDDRRWQSADTCTGCLSPSGIGSRVFKGGCPRRPCPGTLTSPVKPGFACPRCYKTLAIERDKSYR